MPPAKGPDQASPPPDSGPEARSSSFPADPSAEILSRISDAFFALDRNLVVTYFNEGAERQLGRTSDEVVGTPLFDAFPEARGSVFEERYRRALETGRPDTFETFFDVEPYRAWYDVRVYPGHDGLSVYFQVVTERKEAENALTAANQQLRAANQTLEAANQQLRAAEQQRLASEQQLRAANQQLSAAEQQLRAANQQLEASNQQLRLTNAMLQESEMRSRMAQELAGVGVWVWELENDEVQWSSEILEIWGFPEDGFQGTVEEVASRIHPEDRAAWQESVRACVEDGRPHRIEFRLLFPDGTVRWVEALGDAERDISGKALRMTGLVMDITSRRAAEEALRESEDLLNRTGEMARVGGWEVNLEDGTVFWTHATRLIHEVPDDYVPTVEEAIRFFHPDDTLKLEDALRRAREEGEPYDLELRFITASGRNLWTRTMGRARHVDGRCVRLWGTFQDITERKEAEEALAGKTQLLHESYEAIRGLAHRIQAIREQEREELARNLHDELGEALTVHRMDLVQARRAAEEAGSPLAKSLSDLIQSADTAIDLTRGYCMQLHSPVLDLMGVGPAIRTHAEMVTSKAGLDLDCAVTDQDLELGPEVEVNIFRIAQESLTNVLRHSNASRVQIRFGRDESGRVRLAVVDDGVGMQADGTDSTPHLGILGMKERAMAIGGKLTVTGSDEGGTEVRLVVPASS